jgi:outer membrane lipoprotein-sorting protein
VQSKLERRRGATVGLLCIALLAAGPARGGDGEPGDAKEPRQLTPQELDALLGRLEGNLGALRSLRTDFTQEKHLSIFTEAVRSEGVCLFLPPDKVRFEITAPFESVTIARQRSVARYERIEGRWRKLTPGNADLMLAVTGQIATWLRGRFREEDGIYDVQATVGAETTVILLPKNEEFRKRIRAIELGVGADERRITSVVIRERGGDFTRIVFHGERQNLDLPEALFDTDAPAPVSVPPLPKEAPGEDEGKGGR